jgi:hypothetical protein
VDEVGGSPSAKTDYPTHAPFKSRSTMSSVISPYCYRSLSPDSIRLLRLLPHEDTNAPIRCQLFDYPLQESGKRIHLYEALSYVWGDPDDLQTIHIGEDDLPVTRNLHAALSHVRNFSFERVIWVDAICIDQKNTEEKTQQIQIMAMIYGQANRVLVWLGEAADNSDQALEEIRAAGGKATISLKNEDMQSAILALLKRQWFQRIWVREENSIFWQDLLLKVKLGSSGSCRSATCTNDMWCYGG